ncbi:MAG: host attachment protein [Oligoflexia bacterium]|nr:host attachment protein [Oligoflexia bacterium]
MLDWIVILNRTEARIFKRTAFNKPLRKTRTVTNPLGREKNRALSRGKPGIDRLKVKGATTYHSMTREKNPHEDAAIQFAHKVAKLLDGERLKGTFESLIIVGDPRLTGHLRNELSQSTLKLVSQWETKNLAKFTDKKISDLFTEA